MDVKFVVLWVGGSEAEKIIGTELTSRDSRTWWGWRWGWAPRISIRLSDTFTP